MLFDFNVPIGWGELLKRTVKETLEDNALGLAAQLSYYYYFLALFPTLLFLLALASFLPAEDLVGRVVTNMEGIAPEAVVAVVRDQLSQIAENRQGGLLTFSVMFALWSSSAALVAIISALNSAYDVDESRPWWKQRLLAVVLTAGLASFVLLSFSLVVAGPEAGRFIGSHFGLGPAFRDGLERRAVAGGISTRYHRFRARVTTSGPTSSQEFVWLTPGSVLAAALWLGGSLAFRFYVSNFGSYNETYGTVGGIMVLLLWLYLSGLVMIIGAELNSEIAHAARSGHTALETGC